MSNEILNTGDLAEDAYNGFDEASEVQSDLVATHEAECKGIEFHVSMRDHTMSDMQELIVAAAARMLVGNYGQNELAKLVQERAIAIITQKADEAVAKIAADILDQPIIPQYTYGKPSAEPVTMREFIGMTGREYLTAKVNYEGKPATGNDYRTQSRIQHIVEGMMSRTFKSEMEKATTATLAEIQAEVKRHHEGVLAEQKSRIREALARITGETAA